jgi:hypothetical protein
MTTLFVGKDSVADLVAREGWAVTAPCVPQLALDRLLAEVTPLLAAQEAHAAPRDVLEGAPLVRALAASPAVRDVAEAVLGAHCFVVRARVLDETPDARWKVIWRQATTIAVRERATVAGFGPWTRQEEVALVEPPTELLEGMLVVRVHLDDCGPADGPLRVLAGSHRVGRLSAASIADWRAGAEAVDCVAERGAIMAYRPLLVHAASPASIPTPHQRVVQFEFATESLPAPLEWLYGEG